MNSDDLSSSHYRDTENPDLFPKRSTLIDVVSDLHELLYLLEDLEFMPSEPSLASKLFLEQLNISSVRATVNRHLDAAEKARLTLKLDEIALLMKTIRRDYLSLKCKLRGLYRARGVAFCADDWQSPIYASTTDTFSNRLNEGIYEHALDYKRDGHLDAVQYEKDFLAQYASSMGAACRAYLASSGMAAFTTILNWLAHEINVKGPVVSLAPMYFENLHLIRGVYPEMILIESPSVEELHSSLKREQPAIVFVDIVSNCGTVMAHEIDALLNWAKHDSRGEVFLVIDTTCLPVTLLAADLFTGMPENVSIILIESLAKYHQFGLDMVTGGIILANMQTSLHSSFFKTRARLGTNIADSSVASLPTPSSSHMVNRMWRHSSNTELLAVGLAGVARAKVGIISGISWLQEKSVLAPWYHNTCFSIAFKNEYQSIKHLRQFEFAVLDEARKCGLNLDLSTSFGFDNTRLYVTAPATTFEPPFLRVSVGTETLDEIGDLLKVMYKVNQDLLHEWSSQHTAGTNPSDQAIVPTTQMVADH